MKKFKSLILTLPALSLVVLGAFSASASAIASSTPAQTNSGSADTGSSTTPPSPPTATCPKNPREGIACFIKPTPKAVQDSQDQAKAQALTIVTELKKDHTEHTATERLQYCEKNKANLEVRLKKIQAAAAAYLARVDKAFAAAQAYQATHNVQVANWDQLVADATSAQTKAATSVAALQALDPNIDCTSPTAAQQLAAFKAAAQQARTDLTAYKNSVIKIFAALKAVQGEGGTQ